MNASLVGRSLPETFCPPGNQTSWHGVTSGSLDSSRGNVRY
jgi:hypothetical protein